MATISWLSTVGGDWNTAADWSTGSVPTISDSATISAAGTYTVTISGTDVAAANSLTLADSSATISDSGTLSLGSTLALTAGKFVLGSGGVIAGGTVASGGGDFVGSGGTLSGVAFQGTLDMTPDNSVLTLAGITTLAGAGGVGAATINMTHGSDLEHSTLNVLGTVLDNATINIGTGWGGFADYIVNAGTNKTLTLGTHLLINLADNYAGLVNTSDTVGDAIVNDGTIKASYAGGIFTIDATGFTNAGTIIASNGSRIVLTGTPTATLVNSILTSVSGQTNGVVQIGGVVTGGTIHGNTVDVGGAGGTLSGVAFQGTLDMTPDNSALTLTGATTLAGANGVGAATINMTHGGDVESSTLSVLGTATLDNAAVDIGNGWGYGVTDYVVNTGTGATLTLGSHLTINLTGLNAGLSSGQGGSGIINDGTINGGYANGTFSINAFSFVNAGLIETNIASGNALLVLNATSFTNSGTIIVSNGNTGDLTGTIATTLINGIVTAISGEPQGFLEIGGTVSGGTINAGTADIGGAGGTLSGVTFLGTLDLTRNNSSLTVTGGTRFAGASGTGEATINFSGGNFQSTTLNVLGTGTLDGATLNVGAGRYAGNWYGADDYVDNVGTGAILTLGSGLTITQTGSYAELASTLGGAGIVNDGTINAGYLGGTASIVPGQTFTIATPSFVNNGILNFDDNTTLAVTSGDLLILTATSFTNNATVEITANETFNTTTLSNTGLLDIEGGTLSASTLTNSGTIILGAGLLILNTSSSATGFGTVLATGGLIDLTGSLSATQINSFGTITAGGAVLQIGGTVAGGTIVALNGGVGGAGGTLSGVTVQGTLDLSAANSSLHIAGGLTLTGAGGSGTGTVQLTGSSGALVVTSSTTLNNATVNIGSWGGDTLSLGAAALTLTLGSTLNLEQLGGTAELLANYATDTIINNGIISADFAGGLFTVSAITFTNNGTIVVGNGDSVDLSQISTFTNLSGTTLTGGTISIGGGSILQLAENATIVDDLAAITLSGAGSVIEALNGAGAEVLLDATLSQIGTGGTLALLNGRDFTATANGGTFTDQGDLLLGDTTFAVAGTSTDVLELLNGTISGSGTIQADLWAAGTLEFITGGTIALTGSLHSTGTLSIAAGSALYVTIGSSNSNTVLTDAGTIMLAGTMSGGTTLAIASLTLGATGVLAGSGQFRGTVADGGLIDAIAGAGTSTLDVTGINFSTWSGGELEAGAGSTLQLANNTAITADAGGITLSGMGSVIDSVGTAGVSLDASLGTIATTGTLALLNGRSFNATANGGTFTDAGSLVLGGGTFSANSLLLLSAGASLGGSGTISGSVALNGSVTASGGTLLLTGAVSGSGTLTVAAGEVLSLGSSSSFAGTIVDNGTVQLLGGTLGAGSLTGSAGVIAGSGTISGTLGAGGSFDAMGGGTLSLPGLTISGTLNGTQLEADANSVLQLANHSTITTDAGGITLSGTGSVIQWFTTAEISLDSTLGTIATGGTLALLNGRSFTAVANGGTFSDAGSLIVNGGTFAAGTLRITGTVLDTGTVAGIIVNSGTVNISDGSVVTLGGGSSVAGASFIGSGTLEVASGSTFSGAGTIGVGTTLDDAGTVIASGGTLLIDGPITSAGTLTAAAGAVLDLNDGGTFAGTVNGAGSVVNADLINGVTQGVSLAGTATLGVTNNATGEIYASNGTAVVLAGGTNVLSNAGAIGGTVNGLSLSGTSSTLTNSGVISGDTGAAVLATSGSVTVINTGLIINYEATSAALSLSAASSATVTNAGTIIGNYWQTGTTSEIALKFGTGNDLLIVNPGAVFIGSVLGGIGTNTLELAAGSTTGTISGLGSNFSGFASIIENSVAAWVLAGTNNIPGGPAISLGTGSTLTLGGTMVAYAGTTISGAGTFVVGSTGTFEAGANAGGITPQVFTNQGLVDATAGNVLQINPTTLTNLNGSTLTGGTFEADGSASLKLGGTIGIAIDASDIVLNGSASVLNVFNASSSWLLTSSLTTIAGATTLGSAGTLQVLNGASFVSSGTITDNGFLDVGAATFTAATLTVGSTGTVIGTGTVNGTIADDGLVKASGGTLAVTGAVNGSGTIGIDVNSVLDVSGTAGVTGGVSFLGGGGTLDIGQLSQFASALSGFATTDTIDLLGAVVTALSFVSNTLTITGSGGSLGSLAFVGNYTGHTFSFASDGHGGSNILLS